MKNEKLIELEKMYRQIIELVGEDVSRQGLSKTPIRAAKSIQFLTQGYNQNANEILSSALFEEDYNEMVIVKDIELYSLCEHHLLPFFGKCHIAYVPDGKVIGLSKVARIVDHFARRLQIQEQLTHQIASCIMEKTGAKGVGVIIEAKHLCMMMRGVEKQNSSMTTSKMMGILKENAKTRVEFLSLIK